LLSEVELKAYSAKFNLPLKLGSMEEHGMFPWSSDFMFLISLCRVSSILKLECGVGPQGLQRADPCTTVYSVAISNSLYNGREPWFLYAI